MAWQSIRPRRLGVASAAACVLAAASLVGAASASAAATTHLVRPAPMITVPGQSRSTIGNDVQYSTNWSGYAVESTTKFNAVSGTWTEPTATCSTAGATYAAFWAGIDGYSSQTVEQLGTDSDCLGIGRPSYYAWYEMYPAGEVNLSAAAYPVKPGDTLTGSVTAYGPLYELRLSSSEGWTFTTYKLSFFKADSSAELIAESPELCSNFGCSLANLTNFGTVPFSNVQAGVQSGVLSPFDTFTTAAGPHDLVATTSGLSNGTVRALPSSLSRGSGGDSFSVAWKHS